MGSGVSQRYAQGEDENEAIRPVAAFKNQDMAEPPIPHEHRGQGSHHRQFHDERREQNLLGGE
jgi:hypothetical protein